MSWLKCKIKNWLREEVFKEELKDFRFMKLQCMNASAHSDRALHEVDEMKLLYQSITNDEEMIRYDLGEDYSTETAMVLGELYRHNGEWKFNAIGQGYSGGLQALCNSFGA